MGWGQNYILAKIKEDAMKTSFSSLVALWLAASAGFALADVAERSVTDPTVTTPAARPAPKPRVSCTLALPRYEFWINMMPGTGNADRKDHFSAVFSLANKSGSGIAFDLISHCGEDKPVQFILRNAEDEILWHYIVIDPRMACPDYQERRVLPHDGRFQYRAAIPLLIGGEFLEPGEYSLEAFVDGYPRYGAYAPFRVDYAY